MAVFNKESCIALLKNMLTGKNKPVIYYVSNHETLGQGRTRHNYRFFILNETGIYNVSGAVTAAFGVNVTDRSQTFSVNNLSAEDDLKSFGDYLRKTLDLEQLEQLELADLIMSAKETLEFVISPQVCEFLPVVPMDPIRDSKGPQQPVELSS